MPTYIASEDTDPTYGTGGQCPVIPDNRYLLAPPPDKTAATMDLFCTIYKLAPTEMVEGNQRTGDRDERSGIWNSQVGVTIMYSKALGYEGRDISGHTQLDFEFLDWCAEIYKGAAIRSLTAHGVDGSTIHKVTVASDFADLYDLKGKTYGRAMIEFDIWQLIRSKNSQFDT